MCDAGRGSGVKIAGGGVGEVEAGDGGGGRHGAGGGEGDAEVRVGDESGEGEDVALVGERGVADGGTDAAKAGEAVDVLGGGFNETVAYGVHQ